MTESDQNPDVYELGEQVGGVLAAMRWRIWVLIYTASQQGHGIEGSGSCIPEPSQPYLVSGLHYLGRGNRSNKFLIGPPKSLRLRDK
jgi:hypothetical protein